LANWPWRVAVNYGDDLPTRLLAAAKSEHIDALLDFFGGGYVAMAIEDLRLPREKVDTIADFDAVKRFGVQSKGGADAATAAVVAELADLVARGELKCRLPESSPSTTCGKRTDSSNCATPAASWCCDREWQNDSSDQTVLAA